MSTFSDLHRWRNEEAAGKLPQSTSFLPVPPSPLPDGTVTPSPAQPAQSLEDPNAFKVGLVAPSVPRYEVPRYEQGPADQQQISVPQMSLAPVQNIDQAKEVLGRRDQERAQQAQLLMDLLGVEWKTVIGHENGGEVCQFTVLAQRDSRAELEFEMEAEAKEIPAPPASRKKRRGGKQKP